jgi:hypothetical protein
MRWRFLGGFDEVEVLIDGINKASWKKGGLFLDDEELCKQLRRKKALLAQARWQERYYGNNDKCVEISEKTLVERDDSQIGKLYKDTSLD